MHWLHALQHWLAIHTGTDNEPGPYYGFWSGFGSDIGEGAIIVGIIGVYRHHNCHVKRCARLAKHEYTMDGVTYRLCRKHHPSVDGTPTVERLEKHHASHSK
jgi:hypothetical protein